MKNIKQKNIVEKLENLVHKRYTCSELNIVLCEIFGVKDIYISEVTPEDETLEFDNDMEFAITKKDIGGVFDIYYLNTNGKRNNENVIYITEIGYTFDM